MQEEKFTNLSSANLSNSQKKDLEHIKEEMALLHQIIHFARKAETILQSPEFNPVKYTAAKSYRDKLIGRLDTLHLNQITS